MQVYHTFLDEYKQNDCQGVTIKEMSKALKKSDNRTRELMNQLWNSGFLSRESSKKTNVYFATEKQFEDIETDDIDFSKEELAKLIKEQIGDSDNLSVLYPDGRAIVT